MLLDSAVFWQSILCGLCGFLVAWFVHSLFVVPRVLLESSI